MYVCIILLLPIRKKYIRAIPLWAGEIVKDGIILDNEIFDELIIARFKYLFSIFLILQFLSQFISLSRKGQHYFFIYG